MSLGKTVRWVLILAVLTVRAMIPPGFMPDFSGQAMVTICSGDGLVTVAWDGEGSSSGKSPAPGHDPCPFFLCGAVADLSRGAGVELTAPGVEKSPPFRVVSQTTLPEILSPGHVRSRAPPLAS